MNLSLGTVGLYLQRIFLTCCGYITDIVGTEKAFNSLLSQILYKMEPISDVILANLLANQFVKDSTDWPWQLTAQLLLGENLSSLNSNLKFITSEFSPGCCLLKKSAHILFWRFQSIHQVCSY